MWDALADLMTSEVGAYGTVAAMISTPLEREPYPIAFTAATLNS